MVDTGRWTAGPTAEVRLFSHLSFEADALFRGYRFQSVGGSSILSGTSVVTAFPVSAPFFRQNTKEWDFPFLLKYRFQAGTMHPFVDGGYEFAHASSDFTNSCLGSSNACPTVPAGTSVSTVSSQNGYSSSVNRHGPAAGVGIEFNFGKVKISPEVRYTKLTRPNANEVTVLAGFTF
jgi:opacity protein-like surface antigen